MNVDDLYMDRDSQVPNQYASHSVIHTVLTLFQVEMFNCHTLSMLTVIRDCICLGHCY